MDEENQLRSKRIKNIKYSFKVKYPTSNDKKYEGNIYLTTFYLVCYLIFMLFNIYQEVGYYFFNIKSEAKVISVSRSFDSVSRSIGFVNMMMDGDSHTDSHTYWRCDIEYEFFLDNQIYTGKSSYDGDCHTNVNDKVIINYSSQNHYMNELENHKDGFRWVLANLFFIWFVIGITHFLVILKRIGNRGDIFKRFIKYYRIRLRKRYRTGLYNDRFYLFCLFFFRNFADVLGLFLSDKKINITQTIISYEKTQK